MNYFIYIFYITIAMTLSSAVQAATCINGGDSQATFQYSGILSDENGTSVSGFQTVQMRFDLFASMDSLQGDYTQVFESVEVKDGVFSLQVGPCLPNLSKSYYVQLAVNNEDLSTRTKLVTLPVSINSINSQKISGLTTQELFLKIDEAISLVLVDFTQSSLAPAIDSLGQNLLDHQANVTNPHNVTKEQVGLAQVDDVKQLPMTMFQTVLGTTDASRVPSSKAVADYVASQISTVNVTGFELENPDLVSHLSRVDNPHNVTKSQLGLNLVSNYLQLPMSYLETVLTTNSDMKVASSSAVASYVDYRLNNQQSKASDAFTGSEVSNLKNNTLANGTSPWTSNTLPTGDSTQYFRGDKTFQTLDKAAVGLNLVPNSNIAYSSSIAADQFTTNEVSGLKSGNLANGTAPWTNKQDAIIETTTGDYFRGDKTFQPLNKAAVGLSNVPNTNIAYSVAIPADQFLVGEVTNLRLNKLKDGSTPWTAKEDALVGGSSSDYLRGDRTFVAIPADELSTEEVDNLKLNYLPDGSSPWNNSEAALGTATAGQVLAGDRSWKALNSNLVGLGQVQDINVENSFAQNAGQYIETSKLKANSNNGLALHSQSGQGMFISSNGFVGINTVNPITNLHIAGNADVTTLFVDDLNSEQAYFASTSFPPLVVNTHQGDSGVALFVTPSGNVGINTTAPMTTLDIDGVLNVNGDILQYGVLFEAGVSNGATHLETSGALDTFVTTGNFGIGIPNPLEKLEVNGGVRLGYSGGSNPGTIRFNAGSFEGFDGVEWVSLDESGATSGSGGEYEGYALIVDSQPSGSNGGTATFNVWTTRTLQTIVHNDDNFVSLNSNQIILSAGTYRINAKAPAYKTNSHKAQFFNVTDQFVEATGTNGFSAAADGVVNYSYISSKFMISSTKVFELRHFSSSNKPNNGLGVAVNEGNEIFSVVEIFKDSSGTTQGYGATNLVDSGSDTNLTNGFLGLNVATPTDLLDVNGKMRMRTTSDNNGFDGTIRWNGNDLEVKKAGVWQSLTSGGSSTESVAGDDYILLADIKGQGIGGGSSTGLAWNPRSLQTIVEDEAGIVDLSNNEFTLPAGTYRLRASAPAYRADFHKIELYSSTDGYSVATGTAEYTANGSNIQTRSELSTRFTIAVSTTYYIRHFIKIAQTNNGLGVDTAEGTNTFTQVEIFRENEGSTGGSGSGATNLVDSGSDTNLTNGFLGLNVPNPTDLLDVNGKMRMRTTSDNNGFDGTIRWSGNDLEVKKAGVWQSLTSGGSSAGSSSAGDDYALIVDRKDGATTGGAAPSASWTTRTLQTIIQNENNIVQLLNDKFTLQPGTYHMDIDAPASIVARHQIVLVDSNTNEVLVTGTAAVASSAGVQSRSLISTKMTLATTRTFEVRHYIQVSTGTSDLGVSTQLDHSIYTRVQVWKLNGGSGNEPSNELSDSDNDTFIDVEKTADADTISFNTNGTQRMFISSNGNVGIGIPNPNNMLHLDGGITIGHTGAASIGTIRFNEVHFEGYDGNDWKVLDALPRGSLNQNDESGTSAIISGGVSNIASGSYSVVSGGYSNIASATYSAVSGGYSNVAASTYAAVAGGTSNQANGNATFIGGGGFNQADGTYSLVSGGYTNQANGGYSVVSGGYTNQANGTYSVVAGGDNNEALANYSVVSGGSSNKATDSYTTIGGGNGNKADADYGTISGGYFNETFGIHNTISGGKTNKTVADYSTIGGGQENWAIGNYSVVAGGVSNQAKGAKSAVGGGNANFAEGLNSTISGGDSNLSNGTSSTIGGGEDNETKDTWNTISGGRSNITSAIYSTISGGDSNVATGSYSFIGGGKLNTSKGGFSIVGGGQDNHASGFKSTVGGGQSNYANGSYSVIPGGELMTVNGANSFGFNSTGVAKASTAANSAVFLVEGFGINTLAPAKDLHVVGDQLIEGSLCIGTEANCGSLNGFGNLYSQGTFGSGGADYAEYFATDETLVAGDVVGFDKVTGKVRKYQKGDKLVGIISTKPGMVGAGNRDPKTHALVGLLGQLPVTRNQVTIRDAGVYTKDGQKIGLLLADGNVYINLNPADETNLLKEKLKKQQQQLDELSKKMNYLLQNQKN
ncbi:MAG: hypothetical protein KC646_08200 [Candidatus Cloacimonetes bacterium]|nr:hypothetical protein [Candidatus Cloacimonadota bacterium]